MSILITYAGKTGTTERCAKILNQKLKNSTIIDLNKEDVNISNYDLIIIGSNIRMGRFNNKVSNFIKKNKDILKTKKTAYFICCGFKDSYKKYYDENIDKALLDRAITYDTFGGELDMDKYKGFDKFIINIVKKTEEGKKEVKILEENIDSFVNRICGFVNRICEEEY